MELKSHAHIDNIERWCATYTIDLGTDSVGQSQSCEVAIFYHRVNGEPVAFEKAEIDGEECDAEPAPEDVYPDFWEQFADRVEGAAEATLGFKIDKETYPVRHSHIFQQVEAMEQHAMHEIGLSAVA